MVFLLECAMWDQRDQEWVVVVGRAQAVTCKGLQEAGTADRYSQGCASVRGLGRSWEV